MERLTARYNGCAVMAWEHEGKYRTEEWIDMLTDRLAHYEDLEEQGRLVVLPCKVGDTVYQLRDKRHARGVGVSPRIVSSACVWSASEYALTHQGMTYCQSKDLGKTWFLTREEAEAEMKKAK